MKFFYTIFSCSWAPRSIVQKESFEHSKYDNKYFSKCFSRLTVKMNKHHKPHTNITFIRILHIYLVYSTQHTTIQHILHKCINRRMFGKIKDIFLTRKQIFLFISQDCPDLPFKILLYNAIILSTVALDLVLRLVKSNEAIENKILNSPRRHFSIVKV